MDLRDSYQISLNQMIGRVEESKEYGIQLIAADCKDCFTSPAVLSFGGNATLFPKDARSSAKFATRLSGVFGYKELGVFGVYYSKMTDYDYILAYNSTDNDSPGNYGTGAYEFARNHILPLVVSAAGQKLPVIAAKKNLRNLNILATSFGGLVIEEVGNALVDMMESLDYSPQEIEEITRQVMLVTVGTSAKLGNGRASFTRLTILNRQDHTLDNWLVYAHPAHTNHFAVKSHFRRANKDGEKICIAKYSNHETVLGLDLNLSGFPRVDRDGNFYKKGTNKLNSLEDPNNHDPELCLVPGIGPYGFFIPSLISNLLSASVANSVANAANPNEFTELPKTEILLSDTKARPDTTLTRKYLQIHADRPGFLARLQNALVAPLTLSH